MTRACNCGEPAKYFPLIALRFEPMCANCYAMEFPERSATFDLARYDPAAPEFQP